MIWLVSLAIGWEDFLPWELLGFVFLVIGTFVYNEIVIIPIDIFSRNTKVEIARREGKLTPGADYVATSPAAAYDNQRNQRNINARMSEREKLVIFQVS